MEAAAEPSTLQEAIVHFSNPVNCRNYFVPRRWPNGVTCPRCGSQNVLFLDKYNRWHCRIKHDAPQFTLKTGTIMEDSPLGLDKWLPAMCQIVNCENAISSYEIHRALRITQKSAWFLDDRIRPAITMGTFNMPSGQTEADETFIGANPLNMDASKRGEENHQNGRQGQSRSSRYFGPPRQAVTQVVDDTRKKTPQNKLRQHVLAGFAIFTDSQKSREGLDEVQHEVIDHAVVYADGEIHANGRGQFCWNAPLKDTPFPWSLSICSAVWMNRLSRYNNRKMPDPDPLDVPVRRIAGRRVTFDQLTGKEAQARQLPYRKSSRGERSPKG